MNCSRRTRFPTRSMPKTLRWLGRTLPHSIGTHGHPDRHKCAHHRANSAERRHRRNQWVERILDAIPVIPFDLEVARVHSRLWADLVARGEVIGAHDLLVAATALDHDLDLATFDDHFGRIEGLRIVEL